MVLWGTDDGEAKWGGRMDTATQGGNYVASMGASGQASGWGHWASGVCMSERWKVFVCPDVEMKMQNFEAH
jgi:hypothetical protein